MIASKQSPKPTGVEIVGVCPGCHEAAQFRITKKLITGEWAKLLKQSARCQGFNVETECERCKQPLLLFFPRAEVKGFLRAFRETDRRKIESMMEQALKYTMVRKRIPRGIA